MPAKLSIPKGVLPVLANDRVRETRTERSVWAQARATERGYVTQLRQIARTVGDLVHGIYDGTAEALDMIQVALNRYADLITPWAEATATRMVSEASRRDDVAWRKHASKVHRALYRQIQETPVGDVVRSLINEQVNLIRSLPLDAAYRVQALALEAVLGGRRWNEIEKMILDTGEVTKVRATLIARTETGRASTALTQARATQVGSEGYVWRTARDADVRDMHRKLEGTFHRWDDPPVAEVGGERHHPGAFPNCRCWCEPIIPQYPMTGVAA